MADEIFPVYRKYPNNKSFFRILDNELFEEIKFTGKRVDFFQLKATQLPERNLVQDMINAEGGHWVESSAQEWFQQFELAARRMN